MNLVASADLTGCRCCTSLLNPPNINLRVNGDTAANAVIRIRITLTDQNGEAENKVVTVGMNKPGAAALSLKN